jgi:hypothetical protein
MATLFCGSYSSCFTFVTKTPCLFKCFILFREIQRNHTIGCASSTYLPTSLRVAEQTVLNRWTELHGVTYCSHVTALVPHVAPGLALENPTFCPQCIYVFCLDLRTNSDNFLYSTN